MRSFHRAVGVLFGLAVVVALVLAPVPGLAKEAKAAKPAKADVKTSGGGALSELPDPAVSAGGRFGEGVFEGFGDVLAPVILLKDGIVFINPRATLNDNDAEEYNLGVGYRRLVAPRNMILGANVYYDHRETELGASFDQLGLGVEFLSEWVDARANYYLPDDDEELVNEFDTETSSSSSSTRTEWLRPYPKDHSFYQISRTTTRTTVTTTRQHFEQYEQAMEGWDAEIGMKLPVPALDDLMDLKVFGGYYSFDGKFGQEDIEGFKGRLELRAMPSVFVDAEAFEDKELNGTDYYVGARVVAPFSIEKISKGKNPFDTTGFQSSKKEPPFASRLTEMVMRDLHVRTEISELVEVLEKRLVTTETSSSRNDRKVTVASNITFVDGDNAPDPDQDGTFEHPYDLIQEGVDDPRSMVYVFDAAGPYQENVVISQGITVWGEGCPFPGFGGPAFGGGSHPTVDGTKAGPTFWLQADNIMLRGFGIVHSGDAGPGFLDPVANSEQTAADVDYSQVGIYGHDVNGTYIGCNIIDGCSIGVLLTANWNAMTEFSSTFRNNLVRNSTGYGVVGPLGEAGGDGGLGVPAVYNHVGRGVWVEGSGAAGSAFELLVDGDQYINNSNDGLYVNAYGYDQAYGMIVNSEARSNGADGFDVTLQSVAANWGAMLQFEDCVAADNEYEGVEGEVIALGIGSVAGLAMRGITTSGNFENGAEGDLIVTSGIGLFDFSDIEANGNGDDGVNAWANVGDGLLLAAFGGITANNNGEDGVDLDGAFADDLIFAAFGDIQANGNGDDGLDVMAGSNGQVFGLFGLPDVFDVDLFGTPLPVGPIETLGNGSDGTRIYLLGANAAVAALLDTTANNNLDDGIDAWIQSPNGPAVLAMASSESLMTVAQPVVDVLNQMFAIDPPLELPPVTTHGPIQANNNGTNGVYVDVMGSDASVFLAMDVQANGNLAGNGIDPYVGGPGPAVAALIDIQANGNRSNGVWMDVESDDAAFAVLVDVQANNNIAGSGIDIGATAYSGPAGVFVLSSDILQTAVDVVNELDLLDPPLALWPRQGQCQFNGNGAAGVMIDVVGWSGWGPLPAASAIVADSQANGNLDGWGIDIGVGSANGGGLVAVGSSDVLWQLMDAGGIDEFLGFEIGVDTPNLPITPMGALQANGNAEGGVLVRAGVSGEMIVGLGGVEANNNLAREGVRAVLASTNSQVMAGVWGLRVTNNAADGLQVTADALHDVSAAFINITADGNQGGRGVLAQLDSAASDVEAIFLGIDSSGNSSAGIRAELEAELDIWAVFSDIHASNGGNGIYMEGNTTNGEVYLAMGANAAEIANGSPLTNDFPTELVGLLPAGDIVVNDNDQNGIAIQANGHNGILTWIADVTANGNDANGINAQFISDGGWVNAFFEDITANANGANGLRANVKTVGPGGAWVFLTVSNSVANGNTADGFSVDAVATGNAAQVFFDNVTAITNAGDGIDVAATAGGALAPAIIGFTDTLTLDNGIHGVRANARVTAALPGSANIWGHDMVSAYNTSNGVNLQASGASAYALDFGGGVFFPAGGNNSFYANGYRDMRNQVGGQTAMAENNWWGQDPPVAGQFQGSIDYTPWLATDPHPLP